MKRILAWFLALIMVFGMVSLPKMTKAEGEEVPDQPESVDEIVNDAEGEPKAPGTKDGQYFDIGAFTMAVGDTAQLETTLTEATWGSDDETVLTVNEDHVVTALGVGHADSWLGRCRRHAALSEGSRGPALSAGSGRSVRLQLHRLQHLHLILYRLSAAFGIHNSCGEHLSAQQQQAVSMRTVRSALAQEGAVPTLWSRE